MAECVAYSAKQFEGDRQRIFCRLRRMAMDRGGALHDLPSSERDSV